MKAHHPVTQARRKDLLAAGFFGRFATI